MLKSVIYRYEATLGPRVGLANPMAIKVPGYEVQIIFKILYAIVGHRFEAFFIFSIFYSLVLLFYSSFNLSFNLKKKKGKTYYVISSQN